MKIGFKDTDKMTLEHLNKTKIDWTKKIEKIKSFQRKYEDLGRENSFLYKKNHDWINAAQSLLDKLNQIIEIRMMQLP